MKSRILSEIKILEITIAKYRYLAQNTSDIEKNIKIINKMSELKTELKIK